MSATETLEQESRLYEIALLYSTTLSQKEESDLKKEIDTLLSEAGAKLIEEDIWKDVGLAYNIKKHPRGRMIIRHYEIDPEKVKGIDTNLRIVPNIMRHLIIKPEEGEAFVKYSERFEEWNLFRSEQREVGQKKKEEDLRKKIVSKATKKEVIPAVKPEEGGANLEEKIDELISGEDLHL